MTTPAIAVGIESFSKPRSASSSPPMISAPYTSAPTRGIEKTIWFTRASGVAAMMYITSTFRAISPVAPPMTPHSRVESRNPRSVVVS